MIVMIFIMIVAQIIGGCATSYDIQTKPNGAKIFIGDKNVGTTPFSFSSDITDVFNAGGILLRLEDEGYQSIYVWLPQDMRSHRLTFNLTPFFRRAKDDSVVGDLDVQRSDLYQLTERLLLLQMNLMTNPKTPDAVMAAEIKRIMDANPTLGSMYFLDSMRYLREGNIELGRKSLKTALRYAPSEFDFLALFNELKGKLDDKKIPQK